MVDDDESLQLIVKQEPQDVIMEPIQRASERRRRVMDAVVVPYLTSVLARRADNDEIKKKLDKLHNVRILIEQLVYSDFLFQPKVKKPKNFGLSQDTVRERLRGIGYDLFPIPLDKATQDVTVTREFLSDQYGGNAQQTFPNLGKQWQHGLDDFMFPNLSVSSLSF